MKIYSIHYNKPEYIKMQKDSFDRHIKFSYEFIIVNNATDINIKNEITNFTKELGLREINCNNPVDSEGSISHLNSFQYILDDVVEGDVIMIMDHDVFLINDFNIDYYSEYDMVFLPQIRENIEYPWPGLIIFNKLKNKNDISFNCGQIEGVGCDTGGDLYYYIKNNNPIIKRINEHHFNDDKTRMANLDDLFIHLISGSNWNKDYDLESKLLFIKNIV